jgi:flagellar basal-body rod modification protein FlgD
MALEIQGTSAQEAAQEALRRQAALRQNVQDRTATEQIVSEHNAKIKAEQNREFKQELGKDDFLKLLLTQLAYQDPTAPMEDKEFIAQMAQFSSLEQMNRMADDFSKLARMITGNEAAGALCKSVEIVEGENVVQGTVNAISRGDVPQILVNGSYYPWEQVTKVFE